LSTKKKERREAFCPGQGVYVTLITFRGFLSALSYTFLKFKFLTDVNKSCGHRAASEGEVSAVFLYLNSSFHPYDVKLTLIIFTSSKGGIMNKDVQSALNPVHFLYKIL
jgi:hypothetical protein